MNLNGIVGLITDFGTENRFTGIMKGVACSIDPSLKIIDISHDINTYNIMETAYLLADMVRYWPAGTVFCVVVDPGVGSERKTLAVITANDRVIICPDNGILTILQRETGLKEIRQIDENRHRYPGGRGSVTFDGRDIFIYNAARIASGKIDFRDLGFLLKNITGIPVPEPGVTENGISGIITYVEKPFGNLCTNIGEDLIRKRKWKTGRYFNVTISSSSKLLFRENIRFVKTFSDVGINEPLLYIDSSSRLGLARNMAPMDSGVIPGRNTDGITLEIVNN